MNRVFDDETTIGGDRENLTSAASVFAVQLPRTAEPPSQMLHGAWNYGVRVVPVPTHASQLGRYDPPVLFLVFLELSTGLPDSLSDPSHV